MDTIQLKVEAGGQAAHQVAAIYLNGRNLIDLVREVEPPFAEREGHPRIAGAYVGLRPSQLFLPSRHLLGVPEAHCLFGAKVPLLGCECGDIGCWPLLVRVTVGDRTVTWSDFEQPHRRADRVGTPWNYDGLGHFVFDRQQYEAAIAGSSRL